MPAGRPRKWNDAAERQAAYRWKKDVSMELRELRAILKRSAETGGYVQIDACLLDLAASPEAVLREALKQLRKKGY